MADNREYDNNKTVGEELSIISTNDTDKDSRNGEFPTLNNAQNVATNGENWVTAVSVATSDDDNDSRSGETLELSNAQDVAVNGENGEAADSVATSIADSRPKRNAKPSAKSVENRMQCSRYELEKLWGKVTSAMSSMQTSQCSWKELQSLMEKVRENFHDYQTSSLSYLDYLAYVGTPECKQECETIEHIMYNHRKFVDITIAEGKERKRELMSELGSVRSGSRTSSVSSAVLRARVRAEAAAAVKKAEMQKKRSVLEAQSAIVIQKEKAKIEQLCLEEEAAIAIAKVNAIDNELGFKVDSQRLDLPEENASDRVERYLEHQCDETLGNDQHISPQNPHVPPKSSQCESQQFPCTTPQSYQYAPLHSLQGPNQTPLLRPPHVPLQLSQSEPQQPSEGLPCPSSVVTPSLPPPHPPQGMIYQSQQVSNHTLHIPPSLPQSIPQPSSQTTHLPQHISPLIPHVSHQQSQHEPQPPPDVPPQLHAHTPQPMPHTPCQTLHIPYQLSQHKPQSPNDDAPAWPSSKASHQSQPISYLVPQVTHQTPHVPYQLYQTQPRVPNDAPIQQPLQVPNLFLNPPPRPSKFVHQQIPSTPLYQVPCPPLEAPCRMPQQTPHKMEPSSSQPLNPNAGPFHLQGQSSQDLFKRNTDIGPYVEFMARRELIANKIEKFNDKPENYLVWKESFENMIKGVRISSSEKLSLLAEYTTGNAKMLVQKFRSAFITNPEAGVKEVWKKLDERYGSSVVLTKVHLNKLVNFPKVGYKENKKLQGLGDLLLELECAKKNGKLQGLRILDEPIYLQPVIAKLPGDIQNRWQKHAFRFKNEHKVDYPPFEEFSKFIQNLSLERNDPNLTAELPESEAPASKRTYKTEMKDGEDGPDALDLSKWCILHKKPHPLSECRTFRSKPIAERKTLLKQHHICYRCVASTSHLAKNCPCTTKCSECQSDRHLAALHAGKPPDENKPKQEDKDHGGENGSVTAKCTELCGDKRGGRSCAKICLANIYDRNRPNKKIRTYVIVDDQSNCSLAKSELFDQLNIHSEKTSYTLKTCSGTSVLDGRRTKDLVIESLDGRKMHPLASVVECNAIPDSKEEIPTPDIAKAYPHLRSIAHKIPELSPNTDILLLVGRDTPPLHKVHESRNGTRDSPWAQRLDLGWVILGNVCLNGAHKPDSISTYKTHILSSRRPSILEPCPNSILVKQQPVRSDSDGEDDNRKEAFEKGCFDDGLAKGIFKRTWEDDMPGPSIEDKRFVATMERDMVKNDEGNWVAPLPFRKEVKSLPISRNDALKRLKSTRRTLERKPIMKQHYFTFMGKILENGHAEPVPPIDLTSQKPCWYLPHFGVYHPHKPDKIRVVFDSAFEVQGVSLNKLLLSGPDLANSLLGVLLRFRRHSTAFMADIEQMFHSFQVKEDHRDFLRFLWYEDNNPDGRIIEFRMKVHLFGNTSSPAVATYGLRKTAQVEEAKFGTDAKEFVENDFYVDDGLKSTHTTEEAIDLLKRTKAMLATANLRLHKISSNDPGVTRAFPVEDRAVDLCNLDLSHTSASIQRSLGVSWDLKTDTFTFKVSTDNKPFTKRGVLSVVNSLYDPLGIAAPVLIQGKSLLRSMSAHLKERYLEDWDTPLPEECRPAWNEWCASLSDLERCRIPRSYATSVVSQKKKKIELHTFCDASVTGIAAVTYMKIIQSDGQAHVSFMFGKAKLAPTHATTIPRLELCAAVLAAEITQLVVNERAIEPDSITYYSDSRVVLGYITNEIRRFYVYVSHRVERIRRYSSPDQWQYVSTHQNPADVATRPVKACNLDSLAWLSGPRFLTEPTQQCITDEVDPGPLQLQPDDPEVRPLLKTLATTLRRTTILGANRFTRFSSWISLIRGISKLITFVSKYHLARVNQESQSEEQQIPSTAATNSTTIKANKKARTHILKTVQHEVFAEEIRCLKKGEPLAKSSLLIKLSPFLDENTVLRVGGRLDRADITNEERHPVIVPGSHHGARLIVEHSHIEVKHQGRHLTQGNLRAKGYWILGEKRLVNKVIHNCLKCRRLRGTQQHQKMADLPVERLTPAPPFTFVGLDVFGPWQVITRKTRGGAANSKRWAVIFTCLTVRAIHIELVESMDTSSFINALRRFFAVRGPAVQLRCDNGTNFVGARNELDVALKEMDRGGVSNYLTQQHCQWIFNPPHGSHCGGVWERMIGICRRILDSTLADVRPTRLSHEILCTLMAEVMAIVNNRPLVPISSDPTMPDVLTPSTILTQKPSSLKAAPGNFCQKDLCRSNKQWRQVQHLANVFWSRWRKEFLPLLQPRRKWQTETRNLKEGDFVLLRSKEVARNDWPIARVNRTFPSADGKVRKIEVTTAKDGVKGTYVRPVTEVVLLKTEDELNAYK